MFNKHREEIEWGGRKLVLETGKVARQADGAVMATYGETVVLATAVGQTEPKPGIDFFPLTVNYQEKFYAAGKIPGGYFKREGRPTERETLISRLIDRPIRPLFAPGYRNETQVIITVLSHDLENEPDVVAMVAASAALTLSGIPFMGPIGAARVGYIGGEYKLNPQIDDMVNSDLELVVAGTGDAVLMVESEAKELSEDIMLGAVMFGHREMQKVIDGIIRLAEKAAKEPRDVQTNEYEAELDFLARHVEEIESGVSDRRRRAPGTSASMLSRAEAVPQPGRRRAGQDPSQPLRQAVQGNGKPRDARLGHRDRPTHRRPRSEDGASACLRGGRASARPWQRAVHPWRNPSPCRGHSGNR